MTVYDVSTPPDMTMSAMSSGSSTPARRDSSPKPVSGQDPRNLAALPLPAKREEALTLIARDFRSDTITVPDEEMLKLMYEASVGDDVYKQDEATNQLQDRIAKLAGKEAGLFCVSGTMTNQLAIRTHLTQPPHSVVVDSRAHVHRYEAGGIAHHSQATTMPVVASNGIHITLEDIIPNLILEPDIHFCPTKLICLENTLAGMVFPQDEICRISSFAKSQGIAIHCDGARMWDAMAKTGKSLKEMCAPFDTVSLCMSKGLGAPIGSVLVGPKAFIDRARWFRKMFGGGIRQSGGLATACNYAMDRTLPLLPGVHELAAHLASSLKSLGVDLLQPTMTNMVWIDPRPLGFSAQELTKRALTYNGGGKNRIVLGGPRIVLHFQITKEAVEDLISLVKSMKEEYAPPAPAANGQTNGQSSETNAGPREIKLLKEALAGKGILKKTGENGVSYGGN